jgi:alanine dehydrogenase
MKIGILREGKSIPDKRVPFTPEHVKKIIQLFPNVSFCLQTSKHRCFPDALYLEVGATIQEDLSDCDYLFCVKEMEIPRLIPGKPHFFFSHTIKEQPYNQKLLRALLDENCAMVDYETMVDDNGSRLVAFGKFAGIVGAYNGLLAFGKRTNSISLKPANQSEGYSAIVQNVKSVKIPPIKIAVTGSGRVAKGAIQFLTDTGIPQVSVEEFLNEYFETPVFVNVLAKDYLVHKTQKNYDRTTYHEHPNQFEANFQPFWQTTDLMINCIFWDNRAPRFFSQNDAKELDFKISVIADVSCDILGSVPFTLRASTIGNPVFGYDPTSGLETDPFQEGGIDIMAVDNLPCELPADASSEFGDYLIEFVIPALANHGLNDSMIHRATICKDGRLTERFAYLKNYSEGK